jgi:RHS repeat-associated protein
VAINYGSARTEFTYDGFSHWVKIVEKSNGQVTATRQFIWCGRTLCEERDVNNNVVKCFYPEAEKVMNGTSLFYTRDHVGSIREATGPQGVIRARYDYDPYGRRTELTEDLHADFGFTGHFYHAPSGLHLALYRAYDADAGRWLSRDPIGEDGGLNLYDYVGNNPLTETDPFGLWGRDADDNPGGVNDIPSIVVDYDVNSGITKMSVSTQNQP